MNLLEPGEDATVGSSVDSHEGLTWERRTSFMKFMLAPLKWKPRVPIKGSSSSLEANDCFSVAVSDVNIISCLSSRQSVCVSANHCTKNSNLYSLGITSFVLTCCN